jgi:IS5 family transposase
VGVDLSRESVPDATTLLKFRRLLQHNELTRALFDEINAHLAQKGLLMRAGTIVDATIIAAPSSTKNEDKARDPEMHQVKKGNQWHFGMKAHIGVDVQSGLVHSLVATAANAGDVTQTHHLLHGKERLVFADAGYAGADKRDESVQAQAEGRIERKLTWHVAMKRGKLQAMAEGRVKELLTAMERTKAQIRARVEHPFHVIKNLFGHKKARYKGLAKNEAQLLSLFGLANIVLAKRQLLALHTRGAS